MPVTTPAKTRSAVSPKSNLASYSELKHRLREVIAKGDLRIQRAVERETVRTKWEMGNLIQEHILLHQQRADYGDQVIKRLSADFETSTRELHYIVEFARAYPIVPHAAQLSWSEYRELLSINDREVREKMAVAATRGKWDRDTLRHEIKKLRLSVTQEPEEKLLTPVKGAIGTYRIIKAEAGPHAGKLVVDLGFADYLFLEGMNFRENELARVSKDGRLEPANGAKEIDLYTYHVYVLEITDGDTLWCLVDLGFGITTRQQLRLRGLDCPEVISADGQAAKKFVTRQLKNAAQIIITSTKSDKYDRYLADVFYTPLRVVKNSSGSTRATGPEYSGKKGEQYLNNQLLKNGQAVRLED